MEIGAAAAAAAAVRGHYSDVADREEGTDYAATVILYL